MVGDEVKGQERSKDDVWISCLSVWVDGGVNNCQGKGVGVGGLGYVEFENSLFTCQVGSQMKELGIQGRVGLEIDIQQFWVFSVFKV